MSELIRNVSHKGRDIIFLDCAGREEEDILRGFDEMLDAVLQSADPSRALVVVDMTNTFSSLAVNKKGREIADRGKQQGLGDLPTAIVGFTGIQKTVVRGFAAFRKNNTLYAADSYEDALDWLVNRSS